MTAPQTRTIAPLLVAPDVTVRVPGSKSLTNRALVAAALADGESRLEGLLLADDTWAMIEALRALGVVIIVEGDTAIVTGCGGRPPASEARLDVRLSGTTARFLAPVVALGSGEFELDGAPAFRARPMGPLLDALEQLGAGIQALGDPGHLPVRLTVDGWADRSVQVGGEVSSQFLSGLLLAAPAVGHGVTVEVRSSLVSRPYVDLTLQVMEAFGAAVEETAPGRFAVAPTGYRARTYPVEPDASAATYPLAAAAITGGRVRVAGLGAEVTQGDAAFAQVLAEMGAEVTIDADGTEVRGPARLRGIEVDLGAMSDTAQTLAAVAVFAEQPTRVTGIGFIRAKETDRIAAVVTELRRCGIEAEEEADGFVVHPGVPHPATIQTYEDHRMAMSFALLGLRVAGITIADPGCVAKTFPGYFDLIEELRSGHRAGG